MALQSYREQFIDFIYRLQDEICFALEAADEKSKFKEDIWSREGGGGGKTRVLQSGKYIAKGGVNTSVVFGKLPEIMQKNLNVAHDDFFASGISLVIHPDNPYAPTVHANFRYFELYDEQKNVVDQWFGGGTDLTPYYIFEEDARHFHSTLKSACDKFDPTLYPKFKKHCDEYFFNAHRQETRGIGGLFFDYLRPEKSLPPVNWFEFTKHIGKNFLPAYLPILNKRKNIAFSEQQKYWQEIRRGRYVEFNLIHDKGTLFGLKTNGRIESILMSLPPLVRWDYDWQPEANSPEQKLIHTLQNVREWL